MEHRPELDGIRAIAVIAVVAFHSYVVIALFGGGWLGVDVFFVLSGYLITALLLAENTRTGTLDLRSFWVRRLLRLFPALLVALTIGVFFYPVLSADGTLLGYLRTVGASVSYLENLIFGLTGNEVGKFGHTWSLAVEMQFYLLWPPVLLWLLRRRAALTTWILGGIVVSYVLVVLQSGPEDGRFSVAYYMPWTRAYELLAGALVAVLLARRTGTPSTAEPRRWTGWLIMVGLGLVFLVAATYSIYTDSRVLTWESPLVAALTALLLVHLAEVRTSGVGALLAWAPLVWIGKVSYGIYLFHYPVLWVLRDHGIGTEHASVAFVLGLGISTVLAAASFYVVEQPVLRLKRRFSPAPAAVQPID